MIIINEFINRLLPLIASDHIETFFITECNNEEAKKCLN